MRVNVVIVLERVNVVIVCTYVVFVDSAWM